VSRSAALTAHDPAGQAVLPPLELATSPHFADRKQTSRRMMVDVLLALGPAIAVSAFVFRWAAAWQIGTALAFSLATEALFCVVRKKPLSLWDGSAVVTAVILAMSLPPSLPLYATAIGSVVAIGLGKMVFGGLGCNLFNPAMVGRAFLMACFSQAMVTWQVPAVPGVSHIHAVTQATPLGIAKLGVRDRAKAEAAGQLDQYALRQAFLAAKKQVFLDLLLGIRGGSLGETSALALLLGGLYLLARRTAAWQIPVGMLGAMAVISVIARLFRPDLVMYPHMQIVAGGAMLGAFFIATDPVSSPVTIRGRWVFGMGVGTFTMVIRLLGNYPEGVMYSVLLMNALTPGINRLTMPRPLGGIRNE
jgi:electron transport complex protein RnfD